MRKFIYLVLAVLGINGVATAAPGDTTWVQAHSNVQMTINPGAYDTVITFPAPGTSYRKIYMIFTLGKYICGGSGPCGDWDYTVQNYLMTPGGDTLELGRLITPYGNAGAPRTPWSWKQHYVFDVTDYANVLHGSALMKIFYSGWTGGFTADIKFAFIEGTPDRNVTGIKRLWHGSFGYGGTPDINSHFTTVTETPPAGTATASLKFNVTGHGNDANGCCEFLSKNYQVLLNSSSISNTPIWRSDCGMNELYPQSGTWIYERANWCPGSLVNSNFHPLPGVTAGTPYNIALQFDPYTGGGSYTTEATVIYYDTMNKALDASLDQIIAPTDDENHYRENPIVGSPVIHVKNTGVATITAMTIHYGIRDSATLGYAWTGSLASLQETDITLPPLHQLNSIAGTTGVYRFDVKIADVNGVPDADTTNNAMTSTFISAPKWDSSIKIMFRTNNESISVGSTICETSWIIYDINNTIVAQRTGATINTLYMDTVTLPGGQYRFVVYDSSCDGLHWWVNDQPGSTINSGYLQVKKMSGTNLALHGYTYSGTYNNDIGCGFTQYFYVYGWVDYTGIKNISAGDMALNVFPNPAQNTVNVSLTGLPQVKGTLQLIDALGRVVSSVACINADTQINTERITNGMYSVVFTDSKGDKLTSRVLIAK